MKPLDAAIRIGLRIADSANWSGEACTWYFRTPDRENRSSRVGVSTLGGGSIYQGGAGIALFLGELCRYFPDRRIVRTAVGALRHSFGDAELAACSPLSFHSGQLGVALAALRVGRQLNEESLIADGAALLARCEGFETSDRTLDVIGGSAGAVLALLAFGPGMPEQCAVLARRMAVSLANHLLATARRETVGWSWLSEPTYSHVRPLCGMAHGASGAGVALLEAWVNTGDEAYRYGAEQAFLYEDQFFAADLDNWPDFRHLDVSEYLYAGRIDELRDRVARGENISSNDIRYMSAWCHGAPGIGLGRMRAYAVLQDERYRRSAESAIRATATTLALPIMGNFSLCHGAAGNCETLLVAAESLGDATARNSAAECASWGIQTYEERDERWPCGTQGGGWDPSLMVGEAGIGYFLLRLHSAETPSILLPTSLIEGRDVRLSAPQLTTPRSPNRAVEMRRESIRSYFESTIRAFESVGVELPSAVRDDAPLVFGNPDVRDAAVAFEHTLQRENLGRAQDKLRDTWKLDLERWTLASLPVNLVQEFLADLAKPKDSATVDGPLATSANVRLVDHQVGWKSGDRATERGKGVTLLFRRAGRVLATPIGSLPALVLEAASTPGTAAEIVMRSMARLEADPSHISELEHRVRWQIQEAWRAGLLVSASSPKVMA